MADNSNIDWQRLAAECTIQTARSGGSGGHHINKVETKVIVLWSPSQSLLLSEQQKNILLQKWIMRLDARGYIRVMSQATRSQLDNKQDALQKLQKIIEQGLTVVLPRKKTKPPAAVRVATKQQKAVRSIVKSLRRKPSQYDD